MFNAFSFVIVLIFLSLPSRPAFACSCDYSPIETNYKQALIVFEGEVLDKSKPTFGECNEKVRLRVSQLYKGIGGKEVEITNGICTSCDRRMDIGKKYVFFLSGDNPANLGVDFCGGTYGISPHRDDEDKISFFNERQRQLQLLDAAILAQSENKLVLMKIKAEHLLHWEDDQKAEVVLIDIIKSKGRDDWAAGELMGVWLRMRKAQEIWDFKDKPLDKKSNDARSFAAFVLGKDLGNNFLLRLRLENMVFEKINPPKAKFRNPLFKNVKIIDSNFSGSEFLAAHIEGSYFTNTDFSHVLFVNAEIKNSYFQNVDLTGADLTGSKISNSQFLNSNLKSTILSGVDLNGTRFDCATQWPDGFDPAAAGAKLIQKCQ